MGNVYKESEIAISIQTAQEKHVTNAIILIA